MTAKRRGGMTEEMGEPRNGTKTKTKSNGHVRAGPSGSPNDSFHNPRRSKHMKFADLEDWRKDNSHIHKGYHPITHSWSKSWMSLMGEPHTETVNILTHLIGAIIAISVLAYTYKHLFAPALFGTTTHPLPSRILAIENQIQGRIHDFLAFIYPFPHESLIKTHGLGKGSDITYIDSLVFSCFYISAFICFGCSATFHTSLLHSQAVSKAFNRLDYVGIVFLIAGSYYPALYYGFYCEPIYQTIYMTAITIFGATTAYFVLSPGYATAEYRRIRTWLFIGMGVSGVVPVLQKLYTHGYQHANRALGLNWLLIAGAFYIGGALMYAERFPEILFPGKFDIYGSSHQIFHVACLCAAVSTYISLCKAFEYRHFTNNASCSIYKNLLNRWLGV